VHKDLSVGNILVVTTVINGKDVKAAQLSDFEYSRPILHDLGCDAGHFESKAVVRLHYHISGVEH
jgi:hypothetical protein